MSKQIQDAYIVAAVRTAVLDEGQTWLDSAFVVNDWYISAYEPIIDSFGKRVGMLYVGFLETPFRQAKQTTLLTIILAFLAVAAETNEHRAVLHREILIGMLTPQFILVPLAAMLAGLGLTHGLEPLNLLQARLRARAPGDLSPVDQEQAPAEIVPL